MSLIQTQIKQGPQILPSLSSPVPPPPSSSPKISPVLLFVIIILALIFFIAGLLHLLIRSLLKKRPSISLTTSNRYNPERQLQNLFNLHDSGLDQALIESLPVFLYREIVGLKEPFDCAVCLSEFAPVDKLRLLPLCSHAFHVDCIDTWLLSNSSCPLCRGTLFSSNFEFENPVFNFDDSVEEDEFSAQENGIQKRVFSVRLGKFKSGGEREKGETSSSNLDARRCFSMGDFQYILANSDFQIALCPNNRGSGRVENLKERQGQNGNSGNLRNIGGKNESFSVSKIWLWSKKDKLPISSNSSMSSNLPWTEKTLPT